MCSALPQAALQWRATDQYRNWCQCQDLVVSWAAQCWFSQSSAVSCSRPLLRPVTHTWKWIYETLRQWKMRHCWSVTNMLSCILYVKCVFVLECKHIMVLSLLHIYLYGSKLRNTKYILIHPYDNACPALPYGTKAGPARLLNVSDGGRVSIHFLFEVLSKGHCGAQHRQELRQLLHQGVNVFQLGSHDWRKKVTR